MPRAELLQYNIDYDRHETDMEFIMTQLQTHLRERFNVLISTVEYEIVDGHLVRPGKTEPFINSIKRGRDLLRRIGTTPEDFEREDAEVIGFEEAIDSVLANPDTPLGTKILNISLPSGKYKHRFHDIGTVKERNGKRYVEYSRFSSGLTAEEYASVLSGMDPQNPPTPAELLAHPIIIEDTQITANQIHRMLHKDHEFTSNEDFDEIWRDVESSVFIRNYIMNRDAASFNGILNFADDVWENIKKRRKGENYRDYSSSSVPYWEQRETEKRQVRQVPTVCPGKSGAGINKSLWSVSDLGKNRGYNFDHEGTCVVCDSGPKSLGPCEICEDCTLKIEKEEETALPLAA